MLNAVGQAKPKTFFPWMALGVATVCPMIDIVMYKWMTDSLMCQSASYNPHYYSNLQALNTSKLTCSILSLAIACL